MSAPDGSFAFFFVNAVDDPANATAYLGGVVKRDGLVVAFSTDGRAPALSGLLREALDAWLRDRGAVDGAGLLRAWFEQNALALAPTSQLTPNAHT